MVPVQMSWSQLVANCSVSGEHYRYGMGTVKFIIIPGFSIFPVPFPVPVLYLFFVIMIGELRWYPVILTRYQVLVVVRSLSNPFQYRDS